ncbi:MAG: hypothetical protein ABIK68_07185 [bacterium]
MSKKVIVEEKEVTCYEVIKIGPESEDFDDSKRQIALKNSFGRHIIFVKGPEIGEKSFADDLQEQIRNLKDLVAIEVSPALSESEIRLVIEKSLGTLVIQSQFSNSVFIRYVSFGLGELTVRPIDLRFGTA